MTDITILELMDRPEFWARWFRDRATWAGWRSFLCALFGLPMDPAALAFYQQATGRTAPPIGGCNEAWLVVGRRGGKSMILALIACYLAVFRDWAEYLVPGERGTIKVIATDRRQARVIHRYCRALLTEVPALAALVTRDDADVIELDTGIDIEIQTASFRAVRGFTIIAALLDEAAFWRTDDAANPDSEILAALRPAMATIPNAMLLAASSPYARRGEMWNAYHRYWGKDSPVLVWNADTRTMNPTVPEAVIAEAYERDASNAAAEFGAQFRSDIESFVSREVVDAAVVPGRHELPRVSGLQYRAFTDPSGGSSDSFTLAVGHRDGDGRGVLDLIREVKPPFSPEAAVREFATTLKSYGLYEVTGDRYGGEWPAERFREAGITYRASEKSKSDLYRELLPLLNSGKCELLDSRRLVAQLVSLERRTGRGTGRDVVDHPPAGHDDICNSVAGVIVACAGKLDGLDMWRRLGQDAPDRPPPVPQPLKHGWRWVNNPSPLHMCDKDGGRWQIPPGRSAVDERCAAAIARSSWRSILEQ